jgi:translation initiation factor 2B subunit (eIF-2B alpha/beta/delta family)
VTGFAADRTSGSSGVAATFLRELERWAAMDRSSGAAALRDELLAWLRRAQAAQPTMALVHQLAARALAVADTGVLRGDSAADVRAHLAASCASERDDLAASVAAVAKTATQLLGERGGWIATLSSSATVLAAVLEAHAQGRGPRVLLAEGRPGCEGRGMAAALAEAGVPVWLVVDAALPLLLQQASHLWIGADAVTEQGVVNKIGSYAAALAAREHSVPAWSLAPRRKLLPAATSALQIAEMNPAEVWAEPTPGVQPRNVYFELVPLALLRGVVVEDGVLGASEIAIAAADRALPDALAAGR